MSEKEDKPSYLKKAGQLFFDYFFQSDEKLKAWLLLIGTLLSIVGMVALFALMPWCFLGFWAALETKALTTFLFYISACALNFAAIVGINSLKDYLSQTLALKWRTWLTIKFIDKYLFGDKNYLELARLNPEIDNPAQRIQENIKTFVDNFISLSTDFIRSTLSFVVFVSTLWIVGGTLSFVLLGLNIVIPGYLVWASLLFALGASLITKLLGTSLNSLNQKEESLEAQFRKDIEIISAESENIALEKGEPYHKTVLEKDINTISENSLQKIGVSLKVNGFQSLYTNLVQIAPYILTAPLYFMELIQLPQIMQIGNAFNEVSSALNWFINSYEYIKKFQASTLRIMELENALNPDNSVQKEKEIRVQASNSNSIKVKELHVTYPQKSESTAYMVRALNIEFKPQENTLLKAPSGFGKSTLFKTIRKTWTYGNGQIEIPEGQSTYFLPQKPLILQDSLKAVLAYPNPVDTYADNEYKEVLAAIGGNMEGFIPELDHLDNWSKRLSLGQQQRISFARALLKKPDWLFLDEATASLDEESECYLYQLLKEKLPNTTIISIAHRSTVNKFHQRIIQLDQVKQETSVESSSSEERLHMASSF
ncbi:ABC transporter ATP-binding protein/permease [Legionella waltersii]|uniref:ABC transporter n=1 Tax=Legionella waltersii TaxID=66969 RepID=A0A0W1A7Y7_9GAMM|nr:SbmA/BacA-like family transporter [Legionella waltersii]KTD77171.1 ABC transporter [Legionella waltersii]SNV11350.1 ABC transporter [Legionella waltersii]